MENHKNVHPISIIFQLFITPTPMVYDTYLKTFGIKTILKSLNKKNVFLNILHRKLGMILIADTLW
jgi:hypothetical protein